MASVHPTALVDDSAELADDVFIGPYCVIGEDVQLGSGTRLVAHVMMQGPLIVGEGNQFHPYSSIGGIPQDRKYQVGQRTSGVTIGDRNVFRECTTVNGGTTQRRTTIGSGNFFLAGSHVAHDCLVGDDGTFANNTAIAGHCEVGDRVTFGGGAASQQFSRIGRIAYLGGLTGINRDLPPFCMVHHTKSVSSLNLVGLRRAGLQDSIDSLRHAFDLMFRSGLALPEAVIRIREELPDDPACQEMADFAAASTRGVLNYADSRGKRRECRVEREDAERQ